MKPKKLMIIDGNSLIHRGFHAIPHLSTSKGEPTNGVYGFVMIFFNALKKIQPDYVAVTFDLAGPTFRDKLYSDYKAKRVKAPQELYDQIPRVKEFVNSLNLPIFEKQGFEADDVIGTITKHDHDGIRNVIVTGDLDALQLVDDHTTVFTTRKGLTETVEYDEEAVQLRYGFGPEYVVDFKALRGDPSDNIPGVPGIGEKGACDLIKKFGHVEELYQQLEAGSKKTKELPDKLREKLLTNKDQCLLSKQLATIKTDVPIAFNLQESSFGNYKAAKSLKFLQEMEFKSLINQLPRPKNNSGAADQLIKPKSRFISFRYHLIKTPAELDRLVEHLSQQKIFVFDTETTSQVEMEAELLGIAFSSKAGEAFYVPWLSAPLTRPPRADILSPPRRGRGEHSGTGKAIELDVSKLKKIFANEKIKKCGHNAKYDYLVLKRASIPVRGIAFDTMIAAYDLNPGSRGYSLDDLAFNRFGYQMLPITELIGTGKSQITMADVPIEDVAQYSCEDADYTFRLMEVFEPELKKQEVDKVFFDIDVPLIPVLAEMEENGIALDPGVFKSLTRKVDRDLEELQGKIHRLGQGEFNINSPQQLKEVLFTRLQISTAAIKKTKTGLSTAASELEKMKDAHPIVPLIVEYRELAKLKSTYIDTLPKLVNKQTGRLHTSYNQTIAATGRLSSTDPNLQNIPIRTELGNKIREGFVAQKGYRLLSLDYSQIELRVIAHLSCDKVMQKVFKEGKDIHTATAAEIFGVPEDKVTKQERRYAKVINFGVLYGLSAYGLTQQVPGVTREQAQAFIDKYFLTYKGVKKYIDEILASTRKLGYVANELGRKRYLPEINSSQFQVRSSAERAAINSPIQSLAADIIKIAMINIGNKIGVQNPECRLLLQVHDELLFEVAEDKVEYYANQLKPLMEDAIKLSVPVRAEAKVGKNWGEMEKV